MKDVVGIGETGDCNRGDRRGVDGDDNGMDVGDDSAYDVEVEEEIVAVVKEKVD